MMHPTTAHEIEIATDDAVSRLLSPGGERLPDPTLDPFVADVGADLLREMYRDMHIVRRIDTEGVALQRQGQLGLWAPCLGQEAAQVGTARALERADFVFPSYREHGVAYVRGAPPVEFVRMWRAEENSSYDPRDLRMAPPQIIIGAQTLHAVGYAMGIQHDALTGRAADEIAVTYFGDGASSQGDVNEAMVFAASFGAPVVFVCQNNHYAISEPVAVQTTHPIAGRAVGFGIPSLRVDGNDALACLAALRWARAHARAGRGPAFIEAVTYRMGPHTTADDPTRYRDAAEVEAWRRRDPIARLEAHLRMLGAFDDAFAADVVAEADRFAAEMRSAAIGYASREPITVLDEVYAEPHSGLARQRAHFSAYLDGFADEEAPR